MAADYYEILGVPRTADADEIKRAYRRRALELHPDRNGDDPTAQERMAEVNRAYATLSDPERRANYDRYGSDDGPATGFGGNPFGGTGLGDLFEAFFGGGGRSSGPAGPPRGVDLQASVALAFEEAVFGTEKEVTVRTAVACSACEATGAAPGTSAQTCPDCSGQGQVRRVRQSILGQVVSAGPCGRCGATGQILVQRCSTCDGEGRVIESVTYPVSIPAGVDDGITLKLSGRGAVGQRGGPAGDLYVGIEVQPHPRFQREGSTLIERFPISFAQAALGAELSYVTLDGDEALHVPRGTQTGHVLRLRGRGVPEVRGRGRGDLLVELVVETPDSLSGEEEELLRRLAELRGETVAPPGGLMSRIKSAFR
jgi:molecular chaperone DnaJ